MSSILPETKDSNFDWDDFAARINNELIANYGNLFYRVTKFIEANFDGKIPDTDNLGPAERQLQENLEKTAEKIKAYVENFKLRDALKEIFGLASQVNKYFQDSKPWENPQSAETAKVLYVCANLLRSISVMLYPYVPVASKKALDALGAEIDWSNIKKFSLKSGTEIRSQILFRKIEAHDLARAKSYQSKYTQVSEKGADSTVPFSDFSKLNMVVGTVVDVKDHSSAEKLYILKVNLGHEQRIIVSGLREKYKKEELIGKQVIVIENLESKELRGVRSYGMLLATKDGVIVSPIEKIKNGTRII